MFSLVYLILSLIGLRFNQDHGPQTDGHDPNVFSKCAVRVEGNGSAECSERFRRTRCDIQCDGRYQGLYICTPQNGWNRELPHCVREVDESKVNKCILYIEGNGSVNCTGGGGRNVCDIECDGKYEGTFICTSEEGWSSKLPHCAREAQKELETAQERTCGQNEVWSYPVDGCNTCIPLPVCEERQEFGCNCRSGYTRDIIFGICIPRNLCPLYPPTESTITATSMGPTTAMESTTVTVGSTSIAMESTTVTMGPTSYNGADQYNNINNWGEYEQ